MSKIVDVEQRRLDLARATANVIARSGVAGASMREVAAEAGWTTGTLAHYFTNKRQLLAFTLENSLEQRRAKRVELDTSDPLRALLSVALPADDEGRLHWRVTVAFAAHAASDTELQRVQRDAYRTFRSHLVATLVETETMTLDVATVEAERLIALVDGIALQALFDPETWPRSRQFDALDAGIRIPARAVRT